MLDTKTALVMKYSSEILDIVDNVDEFDRGDLQGAIEAQLSMLISEITNGGRKKEE